MIQVWIRLKMSRFRDIRVSTSRVVRTNIRKDLTRARRLLLCKYLHQKTKDRIQQHKRRIKKNRKKNLKNKTKKQFALTSTTLFLKVSESSPGISIAIIVIEHKKREKRLRYATSARFLHEQGRETSELLVSGSPVVLSSRSAEPFSTGPDSGRTTLVFSLLSSFHLFFLLSLYYRCHFFPRIRGATFRCDHLPN